MTSNSKSVTPMTLLSIEAILGQMSIEKVWQIREESSDLKWIIETAASNKIKKWVIPKIFIEGDKIAAEYKEDAPHNFITLKGIKQTKWVSPKFARITDSNPEVLNNSVLPVSSSFFKELKSIEIQSTNHESIEYIQLCFQFISYSPRIEFLSLHITNCTENQLLQAIDNINVQPKSRVKLIISLNASAEFTPKVAEKFLKTAGNQEIRTILVKEAREGEISVINRAAIIQFFVNYYAVGNEKSMNCLIIEKMERNVAVSIFEDLQRIYEDGITFYENGSMAFYLGRPQYFVQFEVRNPVHELEIEQN